MGQSVIDAAASAPAEPIVSVPVADACCDLLELFAVVSDGRAGQGRDHPVAAVLALAAAAVVAGMKGYTAITGWVADVPPAILADVFLRGGAAPAPPFAIDRGSRLARRHGGQQRSRRAFQSGRASHEKKITAGHEQNKNKSP